MPGTSKYFAEKLNACLDSVDAPANVRERANILSKMLDISKQQAWSLLEGHALPDSEMLHKIASEFDVDIKWLSSDQ